MSDESMNASEQCDNILEMMVWVRLGGLPSLFPEAWEEAKREVDPRGDQDE